MLNSDLGSLKKREREIFHDGEQAPLLLAMLFLPLVKACDHEPGPTAFTSSAQKTHVRLLFPLKALTDVI